MIGTDLVHIPTLAPKLASERFTSKCFHPDELARCVDYLPTRRAEHLAGVFAAKEAVAKMFGTGFGRGFWWADVVVRHDELGAPVVAWARPQLDCQFPFRADFACSISHAGEYALAACHQSGLAT